MSVTVIAVRLQVDINSDLGESYGAFRIGDDAELMPYITSANVACGFHAGDPLTMAHTVESAKKHGVAVGAHPGYPDIMGFGRREMQLTSAEVESYVIYQASAVQGFARTVGLSLQHVKPHGALYNKAAGDKELSKAIVRAVKKLNSDLIVFAMPKSELAKAAAESGLKVACEFFADRAYDSHGNLVSRIKPSSMIQDAERVVQRAIQAICDQTVVAIDGKTVNIGKVHTICVHGDTLGALKLARSLRKGLAHAGINVKQVGSFI